MKDFCEQLHKFEYGLDIKQYQIDVKMLPCENYNAKRRLGNMFCSIQG